MAALQKFPKLVDFNQEEEEEEKQRKENLICGFERAWSITRYTCDGRSRLSSV